MALQIKKALKAKGISVQELADKIGINRVSLSNQINGNPTVETLTRIANAIGCDVSDLFEQPANEVVNCPYCGGKIKIEKV